MDKVEQGIVEESFEMLATQSSLSRRITRDKIERGIVEESFETTTKRKARFAVISRGSFTSRHGLQDTRMDNGILVSLPRWDRLANAITRESCALSVGQRMNNKQSRAFVATNRETGFAIRF